MPHLTEIARAVFSLESVYLLTGTVLWIFAGLNYRDRGKEGRVSSALFWLILGIIFVFGSIMPHWLTGLFVLLMVGIDGASRVGSKARDGEPTKSGQAGQKESVLGNKIFLPVLLLPVLAFGFALAFRQLGVDTSRGALVGLGFGGLAALGAGLALTKSGAGEAFREGRRLNDSMGAVIILPQLLASLGVIFATSKVGDLIAQGIKGIIPAEQLFLLIAANCLGMTLFTLVMGNSFAAFPVIATGVLVPLIIKPFGVDPAIAAIVTLTAGSTGTLMTPMAANFNIVPAALLSMHDQYGVIKFQVPFALAIWVAHVLVLWVMIRLL